MNSIPYVSNVFQTSSKPQNLFQTRNVSELCTSGCPRYKTVFFCSQTFVSQKRELFFTFIIKIPEIDKEITLQEQIYEIFMRLPCNYATYS